MRNILLTTLSTLSLNGTLGSTALASDNLAYLQASSYLESAPGHPALNLLDNDPMSLWCEGDEGSGEGEKVRFFFKRPQSIDRIVIAPAMGGGRKVTSIQVNDGSSSVSLSLKDATVEQRLLQPMSGTEYAVVITRVGQPNKASSLGEDTACLGDVSLYLGNSLFGSNLLLTKRRDSAMLNRVLGRWNSAPLGASEKFLTFALDGSWWWTFEPLLGGTTREISGEYRFRGNRLLMRLKPNGRWTDMRFKHVRKKIDPDAIGAPLRDYHLLTLNDALGSELGGQYNNAEF